MKAKYNIIFAALLLLGGCNDNEVFEKEQYKHVFSFISDADHVTKKMFNLSDTLRTGYISLSMGGSNATDRDVTIKIVKAPDVLSQYNLSQYEFAVHKYAKMLPSANYDLSTLTCVIKAGEAKGVIPFTVHPEGLSPDSVYYLPLKIDSYDNYEVNVTRNYLLYQVQIKNSWASGTVNGTSYTMASLRYENGSTIPLSVPGTKALYPISANTVRTMAGNENFDGKIANLDLYAIYLDIADDGKITIRPYKDITIEQIDGDTDYPNKYVLEKTDYYTYHNFLLHYKYKVGSNWYEIKEELRAQELKNKL